MTSLLHQHIERFAKQRPDEVAVIGELHQYSWQQLHESIEALSDQLSAYAGKVVALYASNCPEWIVVDLACMQANISLLPLPGFFSETQLQHALVQSGASVIMYPSSATCRGLSKKEEQCQTLPVGLSEWAITSLETSNATLIPENTAKITFTSGSTGQPKGVCLSREHQLSVAQSIVEATQLQSVTHLCVLPLATLLENIAGVYAPLLSGGSVICLPESDLGFNGSSGLDSQRFLAAIDKYQPQSLILLPELLTVLVVAVSQGWQRPVSLRFIAVGGSKVAPTLINRARQFNLPVYEGYGLSECCSVVSLNTPDGEQAGSAGRLLDHVEAVVHQGEIIVKNSAFLGYVNEPDSWYQHEVKTGDLGYFDASGFLHINGRRKNLLISSYGRNINPEWIESEILANPVIAQCIVLGDAQPYCVALISVRQQSIEDSAIDAWLSLVNQQLPDYARIKAWHRLSVPLSADRGLLTANGRPVRPAIAKYFQQQIDQLYEETLDAIF